MQVNRAQALSLSTVSWKLQGQNKFFVHNKWTHYEFMSDEETNKNYDKEDFKV